MTKKSVTDIVRMIVDELTPLGSDERQRIIQASMTLLGETPIKIVADVSNGAMDSDMSAAELPVRARSWMKQHDLSLDQIHEVFHWVDGGVEILPLEIPGSNNREKIQNAYVLLGIARLLATGDAKFDDQSARSLCRSSNIYDETNHTKYMKAREFRGTKEKGWDLTIPGLKQGASLVAELSEST